MNMPLVGVVSALCLFVTSPNLPAQTAAPGDLQLVHIDTPTILSHGTLVTRLDVRASGGMENAAYFGVGAQLGVGRGLDFLARGQFSTRKDFALLGGEGTIRHGGNDLELAARYAPFSQSRMAIQLGVSGADTPAQSDLFLTAGLIADTDLASYATVYLNPRTVVVKDNTIVGIGLGVKARLGAGTALVADWTPIVAGQNTRDSVTGAQKRADVYGVALRFSPAAGNAAVSFDLGFANGLGSTTGFGLTPGLGGSGAFYFALSARR